MKMVTELMILIALSLIFCVVIIPAQAAAAPTITSISPTQTTAGTFTLTITGSGFDSGAVDQIYWKADGHFVGKGTVQSRTSSKIVITESMSGATPGAYVVKVKNSNGQISNGMTLTIKAPTVNNNLKLSDEGIKFLANHEGCPTNKDGLVVMYNDAGGHCTIGYGHLIHYGPIDGRASEAPYKKGITKDQAIALFKTDISPREASVNKVVKVPLTQYQFDALVSITYNSGVLGSPLLDDLNKGNYEAASKDILKYRITSNGKVLQGLINRRTDESRLFSTGKY